MGSSCKSCKVFAAGLGWSCHDPWVNMSDVTDLMKISTTCHATTMGLSRFRHYGKFSPCDGEHLRSCSFLCGNSGMARGTFVSLCSISKDIVKPWNAQWLMPRGWATCGCIWWVSWGPGWYFKTSDVLVKSQDWQAMSQCYFKHAVPGCRWVRQHSIFDGLKAVELGWSWKIYDGFCQELGRLRGRAAQTSKKPDAWYATSFRFGANVPL